MSGIPEMCDSRCRTRTLSRFPPVNSGRYASTGSSSDTIPPSTSRIRAQAVTGLVIDASKKIESASTGGAPASGRMRPYPLPKTTVPRRATSSDAALICPASIAASSCADARSRHADDMPTSSGLPVFSSGLLSVMCSVLSSSCFEVLCNSFFFLQVLHCTANRTLSGSSGQRRSVEKRRLLHHLDLAIINCYHKPDGQAP